MAGGGFGLLGLLGGLLGNGVGVVVGGGVQRGQAFKVEGVVEDLG